MGKRKTYDSHPFTERELSNKDLVIKMLQYEETLAKSEEGQAMYREQHMQSQTSLTVEKALNRLTLDHFGFDTSDVSVANYRSIFGTYYRTPTDYDSDVINSSYYMRENKCVFYTAPDLEFGKVVPDVPIYDLTGQNEISIHQAVKSLGTSLTLINAFSTS